MEYKPQKVGGKTIGDNFRAKLRTSKTAVIDKIAKLESGHNMPSV